MKKTHLTPTRSSTPRSRRAVAIALVLAAMGLGPLSFSLADSVKIAKFWVPDVTVEKITSEGSLIYTTKSGEEVEKPLGVIEGLKLDAFPDLAKGYAAIEAKKPADAIPFFQKVAAAAPKPWVKQFCKAQLIVLLDDAKQPVESANMLLELARETSEKAYFANPTEKSLAALDMKAKRDLHERLVQAEATLKGAPAEAVKAMIATLGPIEAAATPGTPGAAAPPGATPAPGAPTTPVAVASTASVIPLPSDMEAKDPIAIMLRKGDFAGALKATDEILAKPSQEMSLRLYQNGLAKLYLSLANKNAAEAKTQLMDAGLALARCYYYFPRSTWSGPVGIELGFFHQKIGHPEIAKNLFSKASNKIDSEKDPALRARLDELIAQVNAVE